jgi:hypothetical protein
VQAKACFVLGAPLAHSQLGSHFMTHCFVINGSSGEGVNSGLNNRDNKNTFPHIAGLSLYMFILNIAVCGSNMLSVSQVGSVLKLVTSIWEMASSSPYRDKTNLIVFHGFPQYFQTNAELQPEIRSRPFSSTFFLINYLTILQFCFRKSKLLAVSLNKLQIRGTRFVF